MTFYFKPAALVLLAILSACREPDARAPLPSPVAMTEEAVGHYCNMNILEHSGPKAQIHLAGVDHPVWFSQVRDAVAFLRSPEEHFDPLVVYVHDMEKAQSWDRPGDGAWLDARDAYFVIGSRKTGGMGAPEVIPFGREKAAQAFVSKHGGQAVRLDEIPDDYVLGSVEINSAGLPGNGSVQ